MVKQSIIRMESDGPEGIGLEFWGNLESEKVLEGEPVEKGYNYFTNATGQFTSGVWEVTPCKSRIDAQPADEFVYIIKGTVTLTDDDGHAETFTAGQCYVVPKGFPHIWHNTETVRKFYVIFEEAVSKE
ncbi:MAG: cupin domain-containing protein [Desulfobacterales bacterium]|nr:cupin domain-containing protein [Desulfobacterales bacterium]